MTRSLINKKKFKPHHAVFKNCVMPLTVLLIMGFTVSAGPASAQDRSDLGVPADGQGQFMEIPQDAPPPPPPPPSQVVLDAPERPPATPQQAPSLIPDDNSPEMAVDENLFYDANDLVPQGQQGRYSPRKVNPVVEPASKLIVVTKDSGPNSRQAQLVAANRAMALGRYDAALNMYKSLYAKNPKNADVLMGVAITLQRMGDRDAAIAAYDELLETQPGNVDAEVNMLGLMSEKYPQVAQHRLEELRQKNPQNLGVVAQLAVTHAQMNNTKDALKYLGVAASLQPENAGHIYNMAVIADRAGHKKDAVRFYEEALEVDSVYGGGRTLNRDAIFERLSRLR